MLGVYDFCGHYDWTFAWLERNGGTEALHDYWRTAISADSQRHARTQIAEHGFEGMERYWGHTLREEGAGYTSVAGEDSRGGRFFRLDMYDCPSKGFLIRNGLAFSSDYCDHCIGWIAPMLAEAGFTADHDHDHAGHCWWEIRRTGDFTRPSSAGELAGKDDIRNLPEWNEAACDRFRRSEKEPSER
jgi:hypothetical protein